MKFRFCSAVLLLLLTAHRPAVTFTPGMHGLPTFSDTTGLSTASMPGLRRAGGETAGEVYYITDPGKEGFFVPDGADHSTNDDSAMTLVTVKGVRYKRVVQGESLNVKWFGARGDGGGDDWYAIQKGIWYILRNDRSVRTLYFPPGNYRITRPLVIANLRGSTYLQSTINLVGPTSAKNASAGSANLLPGFNNTFAIGVQMGKGVLIKGLAITGQFTFPNGLNPIQVDTLSFTEWADKTVRQNPLSPYSGIVIDPFSDSTVYPHNADMYPGLHGYCTPGMNRGGSTAVQVEDCSIRNFIVGVMITPSNQQNGELIDVIDCDLSNNKVGYAMGQAQSKECHVIRLKCWGPTHTLFDNVSYGFRHGDGAGVPFVDGANIAGAVKQLCNIVGNSFGGSFRNVYAESLFRLGNVGGTATIAFENCQFDFSSLTAGIPYPDFIVQGHWTTFRDCMLRLYPGVKGARLVLSGIKDFFEGGTMNAPPVAANLDNNAVYPNPLFRDVNMYYSVGILGNSNPGIVNANGHPDGSNGAWIDPVYYGNTYRYRNIYGPVVYKLTYNNTYERVVQLSGKPVVHVNKSNWTAYFKVGDTADIRLLQTGDFVLTSGLPYQDQFRYYAQTYPVGFIRDIGHDTVYLDNLAVGINEGMSLRLWMDYFVNEKAPFTGDIAAGSNTITHVQGVFPVVGDRPDIPMLLPGSYVTAANPSAGVISFSTPSISAHDYKDYTFMNGYPAIEMYSAVNPARLIKSGATLLGGADYYRYDTIDVNTSELEFPFKGSAAEHYRILNTNINGDTSLHKFRYRLMSSDKRDQRQ
jgi:hypothetical protein